MIKQFVHACIWYQRHLSGRLEVPELGFVRQMLRKNDAVVDVGAHAGSWAIPLAMSVPQGTVYAFEALPYYKETLGILLRMRGLRNVVLRNAAIARKRGVVDIVWKDRSGRRLTGLTHILGNGEVAMDTLSVEALSLDEALEDVDQCVRFIKCDVEGLELDVFKGAKSTLEKHKPIVYTEVSKSNSKRYGYTPADLGMYFKELGYKPFVLKGSGDPVECKSIEEDGLNDVLFLHEATVKL